MKFNVKKPLSVFLAAVMLLSVCAFFSAAAAETADPVGASFTVNAKSNFFAAKTETVTVPSGDMFVTVEYKLNAPKMSLINIDVDELTYDPAVLEWKEEYNQITVGRNKIIDFFPFAAEENFGAGTVKQTAAGRIIGNFSSVKPAAYAYADPSGPVTAVKAVFKVLNKNAGTTEVNCTVDTLSFCDENERFPYMKYFAIEKKTVNAENKAKATYTTAITAASGADPGVLPGDVDGNGSVTIDDATMLLRYLAEFDTPGIKLDRADTNRDGAINVRDVTEIQRYLAGIITQF